MALRGSFLVGPRPADDDLVRRFILCAVESGIDVVRLHDPLNDVDDLQVPAAAVRDAGAALYAGLVYSGAPDGGAHLIESARRLGQLGAERIVLNDPAGALDPAAAGELIARLAEAAGVPAGLYAQGVGGTAMAVAIEAARVGAEFVATASYPVAMLSHRCPAELLSQALAGLVSDTGIDLSSAWAVARSIEGELGEAAQHSPPISPQVALRAALATVPVGLVAGLERRLRSLGAVDRLDEVLEEVTRVRAECGYPPTASPIGSILSTQAIQNALGGRRWSTVEPEMRRLLLGEYGHPPAPVDPVARAAAEAAPPLDSTEPSLEDAREEVGSLAASEEDLCLVALFGNRALPLLGRMRGRVTGASATPPAEDAESARVRRLIDLLAESDAAELEIEDEGVRITVRKPSSAPATPLAPPIVAAPPAPPPQAGPVGDGLMVESPMVGTFYRSPSPTSPVFVEEGDRVEIGQTLCILEAMKLFNELKSDHAGVVRRILVKNADPVEYGQPLFELAPA